MYLLTHRFCRRHLFNAMTRNMLTLSSRGVWNVCFILTRIFHTEWWKQQGGSKTTAVRRWLKGRGIGLERKAFLRSAVL